MTDFFFHRQISPSPHQDEEEHLQSHQVTVEFYQEVQYRTALAEYCQWYYQLAESNRRDLAQMRRELNIMGWFCRKSSR